MARNDFNCPVCLQLLRRPVVLSCAHAFCRNCLATVSRADLPDACPVCRKEQSLRPDQHAVNDYLHKFIVKHFADDAVSAADK